MLQHREAQRCQAKRSIRGHQGVINAEDRGTIEGEIENLGRHLIDRVAGADMDPATH